MIISFSEVLIHQTCARKFYYAISLGLAPIHENDAIDLGVKGHKLLQRFYELIRDGKTREKALVLVRELAALDVDFNMLKAWTLVDNYVRDNDLNNMTLHVEEQFKVPASLLFSEDTVAPDVDLNWEVGFTPDIVFERKGGKIDVEDFKFVQRMWPQAKLNRFPQVKLYKIFLERLGYDVSRSILRLFNADTAKIKEQVYTPTRIEEEILLRDFLKGAQEVQEFKEQSVAMQAFAPRTMNYNSCQFCPFENPCTLEAQGKDVSKTLASQYKARTYGYS
jgi:hypothetical protein